MMRYPRRTSRWRGIARERPFRFYRAAFSSIATQVLGSDNVNRIVPVLPWSDRCESSHGGISKRGDAELLRNRGVTWVSFMLFEEGTRDTAAG